jgi:phosphatidylinositol alpha-1,6-mannosyltransferase
MTKYFFSSGSFPPPLTGGSIQYVFNIITNLPSDQIVVHTGSISGGLSRNFDSAIKFRVIRSNFVRIVLGHRRSGKYIDKLKVALVEYFFRPIITLFWLFRINPKIVVFTEICFTSAFILFLNNILRRQILLFAYGEELTKLKVHPLHSVWLRYAIKNSAAIISVSEYTSELLINLDANEKKIYKLLPTVGVKKVQKFSDTQLTHYRNELSLNESTVILTVSRLERRKNHELVLRALPYILESFQNVIYVIVGGGQLREELENLVADLNIVKNVIFAGEVDDNVLTRYYKLADLFILPHIELPDSHDTEGCPTVFFEACANGVPVISGQAGGVKDVIQHRYNGLTVSGDNVLELKEKVVEILSNPEFRGELISNGFEVVKNNTPKKSGERLEIICNNLLYPNCK